MLSLAGGKAQVAELVDALRSGRSSRKGVKVQVLSWAPAFALRASAGQAR